jgi:DnaJ-class molecular chaperone
MSNKDKKDWDAAKKTVTRAEHHEHDITCKACNGTGEVWQATLNRETDSVEPCKIVCLVCGGSGCK